MRDEVQLARLWRTYHKAKARVASLDERIGVLMSQRIDCEQHQAEILGEIERIKHAG